MRTLMNARGTYGAPRVGAEAGQGSSLGTWLVGGLLVGGAVLWARHQTEQMAKLYKVAGLPHQSFTASLRERSHALSSAARTKIHELTRDPRAKIEAP